MADGAELPTQPLTTGGAGPAAWVIDGRYRVLERLGLGGTADVFRAHDEVLRRDVAVKVFRTAMVDDPDGHGAERRELELQSLAQVSHPHLVTLFDGSVSAESRPYLVLECVPGPDLAARLHDGPLPEPEARAIGMQVSDALAYAHARGMVHRDVKPANILLGADGPDGGVRARLSDFGTVRLLDGAPMTAADLTLGTASYLAPEQARGADVGPEADVYSLGLVLIEALTGARCFDGAPHELLAARLTASPVVPDGLPEPWPALLAAMTAMDPALRPTAAQVARSLRTGAPPTLQSAVPLASASSPAAAHRRGAAVWFALSALVVAGLVVGAAYFLSGNASEAPGGTSVHPNQRQSTAVHHNRHPSRAVEVHGTPSETARPSPTEVRRSSARPQHSVAAADPAVSSRSAPASATSPAPASTTAATVSSTAASSSPSTTAPPSTTASSSPTAASTP